MSDWDPRHLTPVRRFQLALLLVCTVGVLFATPLGANESKGEHPETSGTTGSAVPLDAPPQKARDLLKVLQDRDGVPLPGYVGGRVFHNRERRLPRGRYREYDVNPRQRPRDGERIVIEQRTQKAYYTPDHYHTFLPLN